MVQHDWTMLSHIWWTSLSWSVYSNCCPKGVDWEVNIAVETGGFSGCLLSVNFD